jgi:hypothetical protein
MLACAMMFCSLGHAEGLGQLGLDLDAKLEASHKALRSSIVQLRDIRAMSCRMGNAHDCELAMLIDVELALLVV